MQICAEQTGAKDKLSHGISNPLPLTLSAITTTDDK
jgi:hypothetical protein